MLFPTKRIVGKRVRSGALALALSLVLSGQLLGQAPSIELIPAQPIPGSMSPGFVNAPGAGGNVLGTNPGAGEQILSGRPGSSTPRVPVNTMTPGMNMPVPSPLNIAPAPRLQTSAPTFYGPLQIPKAAEEAGPPNGLTLDQAIEWMVRDNLELKSLAMEIPQARADVITAGLRANPLFYWDTQLNPYGQYSQSRPGGQPQIDVNISLPIDFSRKWKARKNVAERAVGVYEVLYQDSVRFKIDNVYKAYLNILLARETLRYAQTSFDNLSRLYSLTYKKYKGGFVDKTGMVTSSADAYRVWVLRESAANGLQDANGALRSAKRTLGGLLGIHPSQAERIELRAALLPKVAALPTVEQIEHLALENRPDYAAFRLGVIRADAEVKLALANRFQDAYLLVQPYTFQNNTYLGVKSATSYAFGMTLPLPLYNRNQGNIARAKLNFVQSKIEEEGSARKIVLEVHQAIDEYEVARAALVRIDKTIVPSVRKAYEDSQRWFEGGEGDVSHLLIVLNEYVNVGKQRIDATARMRGAMLQLNTVVGRRITP